MSSCTICNRRASHLGVLVPFKPAKFGGSRSIAYRLCPRCGKKPEKQRMAEVEAALAFRAALDQDSAST
jgi:hypothetical protein